MRLGGFGTLLMPSLLMCNYGHKIAFTQHNNIRDSFALSSDAYCDGIAPWSRAEVVVADDASCDGADDRLTCVQADAFSSLGDPPSTGGSGATMGMAPSQTTDDMFDFQPISRGEQCFFIDAASITTLALFVVVWSPQMCSCQLSYSRSPATVQHSMSKHRSDVATPEGHSFAYPPAVLRF